MTFLKDQPQHFKNSVTNGKNSMTPWGSLLEPEEIDALWSYVVAHESNSGIATKLSKEEL